MSGMVGYSVLTTRLSARVELPHLASHVPFSQFLVEYGSEIATDE
jgi:hypothetical protein